MPKLNSDFMITSIEVNVTGEIIGLFTVFTKTNKTVELIQGR